MAFNMHCGDIGIYYRWVISILDLKITINPFPHISTPDGRRHAGGITCAGARAYTGGLTLRSTANYSMVAGHPTGAGHLTLVIIRVLFFNIHHRTSRTHEQ